MDQINKMKQQISKKKMSQALYNKMHISPSEEEGAMSTQKSATATQFLNRHSTEGLLFKRPDRKSNLTQLTSKVRSGSLGHHKRVIGNSEETQLNDIQRLSQDIDEDIVRYDQSRQATNVDPASTAKSLELLNDQANQSRMQVSLFYQQRRADPSAS